MAPDSRYDRPGSRSLPWLRYLAIAAAAAVVMFAAVRLTATSEGDDHVLDDAPAATPSSTSPTSTTVAAAPPCVTGEVVSREDPASAWATIIVDTERSLPVFAPPDLTDIAEAGFTDSGGLALRDFVIDDLSAFREAAAANGTPLTVLAAYRSHEYQADLFQRRVDQIGYEAAALRVARPGHSEHHLGTTIDVTSEGLTDVDEAWGATPTGRWIAAHSHEYGFLVSYPEGATDTTCYDYEPWHLRYVGRELAAAVVASGLPLRHHLHAHHPPAP